MNQRHQIIVETLKKSNYKEAERLAIQALRQSPMDAQLWVYLGESLLHQGQGKSASKALNRARLLDPDAVWWHAAELELHKTSPGDDRVDIEVMLEADHVTVAAAILVHNEIRCIERCLSSIVEAVDEIVVIDCFSTDGTREVVQSFPKVKLIDFKWCDDFAAARNAGLPHIKSDWVIWVDADEYLMPEDTGNIREVAGLFTKHHISCVLNAGTIEQQRIPPSVSYVKGRMFPIKQKSRFWGRVHEQIGPAEGGIYSENYLRMPVLIRFKHDGYVPDVIKSKDKISRNLKLLELMLEEEPENPAWWLFYGRETWATGNPEKALENLVTAEKLAASQPMFSRILEIHMLMITIFLTREQFQEAEEVCLRALKVNENFPDALYYLSQIKLKKAYALLKGAESSVKQAKQSFATYRGAVNADHQIGIFKADLILGELAGLAGKPSASRSIFRKILTKVPNHPQALKRLEQIEEQRKLLNEE